MQDSKMQNLKISKKNILKKNLYLARYYEKYLKDYGEGVKPVKLKDSKGNYAKSALVLVYLARNHPHTKA